MSNASLDITGFLKLMIEALEAAGVEYLIGGAIAEWVWVHCGRKCSIVYRDAVYCRDRGMNFAVEIGRRE